MKATITWVGALLAGLQAASPCLAQQYLPPLPPNYSPVFRTPLGIAPDAMGCGFYTMCPSGTVFGPNYCVYPPFPPFNGMLPGPMGRQIEQGRPWANTYGSQQAGSQSGGPGGGPNSIGPNGQRAYGQQQQGGLQPGMMTGGPKGTQTPYGMVAPNGTIVPSLTMNAPSLTRAAPLLQPDPPSNPAFPTHPYIRSPRDFFMWGDMMQEQAARELRPVTAP